MTTALTSISVADRLPGRYFLRGPKRWELLGTRSGRYVEWSVSPPPSRYSVTTYKSNRWCGAQGVPSLLLCKKHLASKRFATDADVKQAVRS